jgi:hypothetical protein
MVLVNATEAKLKELTRNGRHGRVFVFIDSASRESLYLHPRRQIYLSQRRFLKHPDYDAGDSVCKLRVVSRDPEVQAPPKRCLAALNLRAIF